MRRLSLPEIPFRSLARGSAALALVAVLAACSGGGNQSQAPAASGGGAGAEGTVSADDLKFNTEQLELTAGEETTIEFQNADSAPHNIAIYTDESHSETLFQGEVINGGESVRYEIPALEAGEYYFHCDVHPDMNGTVTVE